MYNWKKEVKPEGLYYLNYIITPIKKAPDSFNKPPNSTQKPNYKSSKNHRKYWKQGLRILTYAVTGRIFTFHSHDLHGKTDLCSVKNIHLIIFYIIGSDSHHVSKDFKNSWCVWRAFGDLSFPCCMVHC